MIIAMVRDVYLNPWDVGNYYGVTEYGAELYCCGSVYGDIDWPLLAELYPKAHFIKYRSPYEVFSLEPDVIDVPDLFYDISRYFLARFEKTALVAWDNLPGRNFIHREYWNKAAVVVCRSEAALKAAEVDGCPDNVRKVIISGAVDTNMFCPDEETDGSVIFVGRLVPEKGLSDLIWALAGSDIPLKVIGSGNVYHYRNLARQYGVKATFYDELRARPLLARIMSASSILCVPSLPLVSDQPGGNWVEQFGQVFVEAMACGLPVVSYATGAVPEVVGEAGCLVQPRNFYGLRDAIMEILRDDQWHSELSVLGRGRALNKYSYSVIGSRINDEYRRLID